MLRRDGGLSGLLDGLWRGRCDRWVGRDRRSFRQRRRGDGGYDLGSFGPAHPVVQRERRRAFTQHDARYVHIDRHRSRRHRRFDRRLADRSGERSRYAPFSTGAQEGAYGLTLTYTEMGTVRAIHAPPGGAPRVFRAEMFDVAGHKATADISINLTCRAQAICYGTCKRDCTCPPGFVCNPIPGLNMTWCVNSTNFQAPACTTETDCRAVGLQEANCSFDPAGFRCTEVCSP